jgi:hypothetical protein
MLTTYLINHCYKTRKIVVFAILAMTFSGGVCCAQVGADEGGFSGGSGTSGDPYMVTTAAELVSLSLNTTYWDKAFLLANDIDMAKVPFTPIGTANKPFTGEFDGGFNVIANLSVQENTAYEVGAGLFGVVDEAPIDKGDSRTVISNVQLVNPTVIGMCSQNIGALVGILRNGHVMACSVEGGHLFSKVNAFSIVGGLIGSVVAGTVEQSYANTWTVGTAFVGGLIGQNGDDGTVKDCYALGRIVLQALSCQTQPYTASVGGLIGKNMGMVSSSYAYCGFNIPTCTPILVAYVGGLVGEWIPGVCVSSCIPVGCFSFSYSTCDVSEPGDINVKPFIPEIPNPKPYSECDPVDICNDPEVVGLGVIELEKARRVNYEEMHSVLDHWDFDEVWYIRDGQLPRLQWQNSVPVADAGNVPSETIKQGQSITVSLDGSGSTDPDGDSLTYTWAWTLNGTTYRAVGAKPSIILPVGNHSVSLVVNDGVIDSVPDTATVEINAIPVVVFGDAALKAAVEAELGIQNPDEDDMLRLVMLDASGLGITDLGGLESALNLKSLVLRNNGLADISLLTDLVKLERLDLGQNSITAVSPLEGMANLWDLWLDSNEEINDLSSLAGLNKLAVVMLCQTQLDTSTETVVGLGLIQATVNANGGILRQGNCTVQN